jgi:predicted ATPase with chaperone activity
MNKNEIKGQHVPKRTLEIAAAGDHSILLYGPRGAGKATLIAAFPEAEKAVQRDTCFCGNYQNPSRLCSCNPRLLYRWTRRVSRLADECDMVIEVCLVPMKEWNTPADPRYAECFAPRVAAAREFGKIHQCLDLTDDSACRTFEMAARRLGFSIGTGQRILWVARTIANLDQSPVIKGKHVAEAVQYKAIRILTYD